MREIGTDRLSAGSVFKFGYLANLALMMPVMLFFGILGMTGGTAVYQNGQPVYGITALVTAVAMGIAFPAILATWLMLGTLILRFFKARAPSLRLRGE
ncbi:hypothetical protein [Sphingomonas sp. M1-B02]|uniref:hypothetical protein n=1 Tax=Sphingomonas sp. M1-B02 TaxID=3114300 RepID=UPI00223FF950|nr:hypothetical protein [Sphingomonas sp. S6-11]UZK67223.1 hypothetical protein OKW87_05160 [Sphingomonas sp. S6-11]